MIATLISLDTKVNKGIFFIYHLSYYVIGFTYKVEKKIVSSITGVVLGSIMLEWEQDV